MGGGGLRAPPPMVWFQNMLYMTPQVAPTTDPRSTPYIGACGVPWGVHWGFRWMPPGGPRGCRLGTWGVPPGGPPGGPLGDPWGVPGGAPGRGFSPECSFAKTQVVLSIQASSGAHEFFVSGVGSFVASVVAWSLRAPAFISESLIALLAISVTRRRRRSPLLIPLLIATSVFAPPPPMPTHIRTCRFEAFRPVDGVVRLNLLSQGLQLESTW
jgi:hypothetical protein